RTDRAQFRPDERGQHQYREDPETDLEGFPAPGQLQDSPRDGFRRSHGSRYVERVCGRMIDAHRQISTRGSIIYAIRSTTILMNTKTALTVIAMPWMTGKSRPTTEMTVRWPRPG